MTHAFNHMRLIERKIASSTSTNLFHPMEDYWNSLTHRVDSFQKGLHSACDFQHEACDFHPKGLQLIDRKNPLSGHSIRFVLNLWELEKVYVAIQLK